MVTKELRKKHGFSATELSWWPAMEVKYDKEVQASLEEYGPGAVFEQVFLDNVGWTAQVAAKNFLYSAGS